jgi:hypothetical protein
MIRSTKALGLIVAAALTIGAMAAPAAQAEPNGILTSGTTENGKGEVEHTATPVHGVQENNQHTLNKFTITELEVSCNQQSVKYYGQTTGTDKELTLEPVYKECGNIDSKTDEINSLVTITMEGCDYSLNQPVKLGKDEYTGTVDLVCPEGKHPIIHQFLDKGHTIPLCTIEIEPAPTNQNLGHIIYHNENNRPTAPDHITANVAVENIVYETNGKSCPEPGGTGEDGKLITTITLTSGETNEAGETVSLNDDLWISDETP